MQNHKNPARTALFCLIIWFLVIVFIPVAFWGVIEINVKVQEENYKNNRIVIGKDTKVVWQNKYIIYHGEADVLMIHNFDNGEEVTVLGKIESFDSKNNKFYIVSKEGYAVIDKDNLCKVFLCESDQRIENENIKYITSFDEFDIEDIEQFHEIEKKVY